MNFMIQSFVKQTHSFSFLEIQTLAQRERTNTNFFYDDSALKLNSEISSISQSDNIGLGISDNNHFALKA